MGKKIDGFVLSVLVAFALYLYFCRWIGNHTVSLLLSALSYFLISKLIRKLYLHISDSALMQKRRYRKQAGSAVMHLACMEEDLAHQQLSELLKQSYDCDATMELVQWPPSSTLTQEKIFDLWKVHRGEDQLVICASCASDSNCKSMCASMKQPKIALLDANALAQLFAEHPQWYPKEPGAVPKRKHRFKQLGALLFQRKNAPRCLLFSAVMLMMYLLGGRISNLIASLALLFLALSALKRPSRPSKLF